MSDNKKLLSENTIRRFMTLANVGPLSDNFIQENAAEEEITENEEEITEAEEEITEAEEELEEGGMYYARDDEEGEEEPEMDMDMGAMDADEPEGAPGAADISLTEEEAQLLIDLGERLSAAMGDAEEPEPEMDMGDEEPEPEMDMGAEEEEEEEDPMMQEELVQEVLKRVTKRIVAAKLKNK